MPKRKSTSNDMNLVKPSIYKYDGNKTSSEEEDSIKYYYMGNEYIRVDNKINVDEAINNYIIYVMGSINAFRIKERCFNKQDLNTPNTMRRILVHAFMTIIFYNEALANSTIKVFNTTIKLPFEEPGMVVNSSEGDIYLVINDVDLRKFIFDSNDIENKFDITISKEGKCDYKKIDNSVYNLFETKDKTGIIDVYENKKTVSNQKKYKMSWEELMPYFTRIFVVADHMAHHYFLGLERKHTEVSHDCFELKYDKYLLGCMIKFKENDKKGFICRSMGSSSIVTNSINSMGSASGMNMNVIPIEVDLSALDNLSIKRIQQL